MATVDRRTVLAGLLGTAALTAAGCSGGSDPVAAPSTTAPPSPSSTPTPTPTPTPVDDRPRWPLTGQVMADPAAGRHPAVAVKVPDNKVEHPQAGLDQADLVIVELEGYRDAAGYSATRLMPVFHSRLAADVAPVRSIRPVDIAMLAPMSAVIGNTGASPWVTSYAQHFRQFLNPDLTYMNTRGTGAYSIDRSRVYQYQGNTYYDRAVVCHPAVLAARTTTLRDGPARAYLPWATSVDVVSTDSGRPARTVAVPWKKGDSYDMTYHWDAGSGRYLRSMPWGPHVLADRTRVACDNVLVLRARQIYGRIDVAGHVSAGGTDPEPIQVTVQAGGTFVYAHGGRYVTGRWSKGAVDEVFALTLDDGSALKMAPGQTYVELPRIDADVRISA